MPRASIYFLSLFREPFDKITRKPMLILSLLDIYGLTMLLALHTYVLFYTLGEE
jgi:hypothetical protein